MSWAEDEAKRITESEERRERQREWRLHAKQVRDAKGPVFYVRLTSFLATQIEEFNHRLADHPEQRFRHNWVKSQAETFWFHRAYYPEIYVKLNLNLIAGWIEFDRRVTPTSIATPISDSGRFELRVDTSDELHLFWEGQPVTFEEALQLVLKPILSP